MACRILHNRTFLAAVPCFQWRSPRSVTSDEFCILLLRELEEASFACWNSLNELDLVSRAYLSAYTAYVQLEVRFRSSFLGVVLQVRYFRKLVESFSLCLLLCYMLLTISRRDECRHTSRAYRAREREKGNRKWKNGSRL